MRKSLLLFIALAIGIGVFSRSGETNAQSPIDVDESNYRVPVIGDDFEMTRLECPGHIPGGQEPGIRFMDVNITGAVATDEGTPIYSSGDGTVVAAVAANENTARGRYVEIHNDEVGFRYMHLAKVYVTTNQTVSKGDLIGYMGNTGHSRGPHLHWEGWPMPNHTFNILDIQGVNETTGSCTPNPTDGTIVGQSRFRWDSCESFYNDAIAEGFQYVVLFDNKLCRGNALVLPWTGYAGWNLASIFNDRTRSIFIPPGFSIIISADANNPNSLYLCHTNDMWDLDVDNYTNSTTKAGWQGGEGYNMVSFVTVRPVANCPNNNDIVSSISYAPPDSTTNINTHVAFASIAPHSPNYGNSHVDIRENTYRTGTQYGWDSPTNGWFNVPDYMDDKTSSVEIDGNFSMKVAKDQNGGGSTKCLVSTYDDLSGAYYDDGSPMTDTISSVWVYTDPTCGGTYIGTVAGDTVTVWVDLTYSNTHYGWHDPFNNNVENYVANGITSIGIAAGWSAVVYENSGLSGGFACFTSSDPDLTNNNTNTGTPVNDNIESIEIFHDSICGGRMHAPTVTFDASVTDMSIKQITAPLTWSGAAPGWQHYDFGDSQTYDVQGGSGNVSPTHQYANFGTYNVVVTVYGTDGIGYPYTKTVNVIPPPPTYSVTINSAHTGSGLVDFTVNWSGALADWHHIDFGDGQGFDVNGASGHQSASHVYNPVQNPYNLSFTVKGQDSQNYVASQQVSMPLPTVSLTINSVDPVTGFTMFTAAWTDAPIDSWQRITFGQEDFYVDYQGASDTKVDSHIYPPGTYTMTLTVNCRNGQTYTASQQIVVTGPTATPVPPTVTPAPPSYSLTIDSVDQNSGLTTFTLDWGSALADWHHIDFGDGQAFDVNGGSGHQQSTHIYNPGTYNMTFTVKGLDGQNYPSTQQITVSGPPTATPVPPTATPTPPTLSLTIVSVDNVTGLVTFQAVWNSALNDWQHMDFGHDAAYVDYQGGSGDHTDSNTIPVGTYTFTLTVKGLDGQNYTASQQVTRS